MKRHSCPTCDIKMHRLWISEYDSKDKRNEHFAVGWFCKKCYKVIVELITDVSQ